MGRVGEVGGQILVESSVEPLRDAYSIVASLVEHYMRTDTRQPDTRDQHALVETGNALMAKTQEVLERAQEHLVELETPVSIKKRR